MAIFRSPGLADSDAPNEVIDAWNRLIVNEVAGRPASPFLVLNPATIPGGTITAAVKWTGEPLEPANCLDEDTAEQLSDWGLRGRLVLHNEYLEYGLVVRPDPVTGRLRPKRFVATTELMEWWRTMAVQAPQFFVDRANSVAGTSFSSVDLLGMSVAQWSALSVPQRSATFSQRFVGANGSPPRHSINHEHLLFMQHQINGLDDLIFVVHFGAFPYAVREGGVRRRARIEEVFRAFGREELFCRNADPNACNGAYGQAFLPGTEAAPMGTKVAFADPLGMYIRSFSTGDLFLNDAPLPKSWTTLTRGAEHGLAQRLVFGPSDAENAFLDDVTVGRGPGAKPVTGYKLAKRIEVGPLVVVGAPEAITSAMFNQTVQGLRVGDLSPAAEGVIACGSAGTRVCQVIGALKQEFDMQASFAPGTRGGRLG